MYLNDGNCNPPSKPARGFNPPPNYNQQYTHSHSQGIYPQSSYWDWDQNYQGQTYSGQGYQGQHQNYQGN